MDTGLGQLRCRASYLWSRVAQSLMRRPRSPTVHRRSTGLLIEFLLQIKWGRGAWNARPPSHREVSPMTKRNATAAAVATSVITMPPTPAIARGV